MQCQKRIANKELILRFGDGKHKFYLESVCGNPTESESESMCERCAKLKSQFITQFVRTFPHGIIDGEYPPESHMFDSPWYHKKLKAYGLPAQLCVELAMKAQKRAKEGTKTTSLKELIAALSSDSSTDEFQIQDELDKIQQAKKPKKKTKKGDEKPQVLTEMNTKLKFVESMDEPIQVDEIVDVYLEKYNEDGQDYWLDKESLEYFEITEYGKRGECLGVKDCV